MHPRLVELYDLDNPDGIDHDWFRALADRLDARTIVDLGCGTGMLTVTLATAARRVVGVDPDAEMLAFARNRPPAPPQGRVPAAVEWVHGDSRAIGEPAADLVVMSGNVAQAIIGADWPRTLSDIHGALRPGGALAFESRNPSAQAWQGWTRAHTYGERETPSGPLAEWLEVTDVEPDDPTEHGAETRVTFAAHNVFGASGEHLVHTQTLAFRSRDQLRADLAAAGLELTRVTADWQQEPVTPDARLLVVEARRPVGRSMGGVPRAR